MLLTKNKVSGNQEFNNQNNQHFPLMKIHNNHYKVPSIKRFRVISRHQNNNPVQQGKIILKKRNQPNKVEQQPSQKNKDGNYEVNMHDFTFYPVNKNGLNWIQKPSQNSVLQPKISLPNLEKLLKQESSKSQNQKQLIRVSSQKYKWRARQTRSLSQIQKKITESIYQRKTVIKKQIKQSSQRRNDIKNIIMYEQNHLQNTRKKKRYYAPLY